MQRKFFFLACFFTLTHCLAQQHPFVYYTPRDGLINSRVRCIRQDGRGLLYFATFGGLSVYDGTRFTNYNIQNGLANDLVNDIAEAGQDSMLIATNTHQLNTLSHGKIGSFLTADHFCPVINKLLKSSNGQLYVSADEGLYQLSGNRFIRLPFEDSSGKDVGNFLDRIIEWDHYFLILKWNSELREKLVVYDRNQKKIIAVYTHEKIFGMSVDHHNRIWISTSSSIHLLDTLALTRGTVAFLPLPKGYENLAFREGANIYFDRNGNEWFFNSDKIQHYDKEGQTIISGEEGLRTEAIVDIFEDREGMLWMATDGNGIVKMRNSNIELLDHLFPDVKTIVLAMTEQNDSLWFFSKPDHKIYALHKNNLRSFPLGLTRFSPLHMYVQGNSLVLTDSKKMVLITSKDKPSSYLHPRIIVENSNLDITTGINTGLGYLVEQFRWHDSLFYLIALKNNQPVDSIRISYATDQMIVDSKGILWTACRNSHLMAYKLHPESPSHYFELLHDYYGSLPEISPRAITLDGNNQIWIGTRYSGIFLFRIKNDSLHKVLQYTTRNGLTDNFINYLGCDHHNTVWAGTQTGLDKIFYKDGTYVIGNVSKSNDFFQFIIDINITSDNTVYALSSQGTVLKILPYRDIQPGTSPGLLLTSLLVNNKWNELTQRSLAYNQNNLQFTVAAPSFIDEKSIRYSYLLEGSGINEWSEASNNASFNFINLSPGKYTLKVRSEFPEAKYPAAFLSYSFTVLTPWWQSWWFLSLTALGILVLVLLFVRQYYHNRLARQQALQEKLQAIEKERTRIATDMHDDLGAGLSRIKFLSETIGLKKQQHLPIEEDINKIKTYSHEMIDKMGEIVWALNEKNDSLNDLLSYTRAFAVEFMEEAGIKCQIRMPNEFPGHNLSGEFRRNFFLSVKEILNNIAKHAGASCVIIVVEIDTQLVISISDDGSGFTPGLVKPLSNGLINIAKRMKDIGGTMDIRAGNGTTISLKAYL